ncbi:MAG: iron ABC transporter permease, partial [Candidatus Cloacimonadota bacterium]|nr:iron ABC transporter permease [Candidatus Cloacimonadota bacterium]
MNKRWFPFLFFIAFILISFLYLFYRTNSQLIFWQIRIPRYLLTFLTGFILAGVGSIFQIMLNNSLAEPYILGISSGAALGSTIAIVSGLVIFIPIFGFFGAFSTMILVWKLSFLGGYFNTTKLLLSGIIVGMFFSAMISLLMYLFQQDIGNIIQILMGNLGHIFSEKEWYVFLFVFSISMFLMIYLYFLSTKINILASGELSAISLGVDVKKLRKQIFFISSILTGVTVAYAGIIGFVGLVIPHILRMILGVNLKKNFWYICFAGVFLLLICDFIAVH